MSRVSGDSEVVSAAHHLSPPQADERGRAVGRNETCSLIRSVENCHNQSSSRREQELSRELGVGGEARTALLAFDFILRRDREVSAAEDDDDESGGRAHNAQLGL